MNEWNGIAASAGYALGKAYVLPEVIYNQSRRQLSADELGPEVRRFKEKVTLAVRDITVLKERAVAENREVQAAIFATHLSLLKDPEYIGEVNQRIVEEAINAEAALSDVTEELIALFSSMDNDYLKERSSDLRDISARIGAFLSGHGGSVQIEFSEPVVMIGFDLAPSLTAKLDPSQVAGFAVDSGGKTSHSAIIARSLGIPAVVGASGLSTCVQTGDFVILDGHQGIVLVNPSHEVQEVYRRLQLAEQAKMAKFDKFRELATLTADGHHVELAINIAHPKDAQAAHKVGAEGIGLYRTEFLFMGRDKMPSEEEQYYAYRAVVQGAGANQPVVIRTLDVGGDKEIAYLQQAKESNPFLGFRAIRLCLAEENKDMFSLQLRAILRASAHGNVKLMYPMIATLQELRAANHLLDEAKSELRRQGIRFNEQMEVGVMIEVPAAALIAEQLAKEVDFFSIGTNDLVQYTMAADRMNEQVAYLTQPLHPAILRLIEGVILAAHSQHKWVGMCGEMAGHPDAIPILLGLGLDEFSMSPSAILPAREMIAGLKRADMEKLAKHVLQLESVEEIEQYVRTTLSIQKRAERDSSTFSDEKHH